MNYSRQQGFTLIESVFGLGIAGVIILVLSLFFGNGVGSYRQQFEQVLITENTRAQLERFQLDLRQATNTTTAGWLRVAGETSISFYANIDDDVASETVTYSLVGTTFTRYITDDDTTTASQIVSENIQNSGTEEVIFTYLDVDGNELTLAEADSQTVRRVDVKLLVDINEQTGPVAVNVSTQIFPRSGIQPAGTAFSYSARLWPVTINYPASPTTDGLAHVTITNPDTSDQGIQVWPVININSGWLTTYASNYNVNINYQADTVGSNLPGWYAWVGPILVGQSGEQQYYVTDQVPVTDLCLDENIDQLLVSCSLRTVSAGAFEVQYRPIVLYTNLEEQDYVKEITFTYSDDQINNPAPSQTPTPTPTPTETPSPSPSESPTPVPTACQADVHICPDGTEVGRTLPTCEFICPSVTPHPNHCGNGNCQLDAFEDVFNCPADCGSSFSPTPSP